MDLNKLSRITVANLTAICRTYMTLSRLDCQTRGSLYSAIQIQPTFVQEAINVGVERAIQSGLVKHGKTRERREDEDFQVSRKRQHLQEEERDSTEENGENPFLKIKITEKIKGGLR